jgi:hypothetical protein
MDVSKYIKEKNTWIFDDTFNEEVLGLFVDAKAWKTNGGKDTDVFVFCIEGTNYLIMPFKIDYTDLVEIYGTDTDKWKNKGFYMSKNKKGKYVLKALEEKVLK